jgi:hypothetical protein
VHQRAAGVGGRAVVAFRDQLVQLGGGQQRQLAHSPFGRRHRGGQQREEMLQEAADRRPVEEIYRVLEIETQAG